MNSLPQLQTLRRVGWITLVAGILAIFGAVAVSNTSASRYGDAGLVAAVAAVAGILLTVALVAGVGATVLSGVQALVADHGVASEDRAPADA